MNDIVIMYHYVREKESWTGSVPINPENFRKQIEWVKENYEIISPDDMDRITKKPKCIISFDDATKDQYSIAYPILKELKVPGYFTVMSAPLEFGVIPIFHLVHTVLSHFTDKEIWNELNTRFYIPDLTEKSSYYSYENNVYRRYNKYVFNFLLNEQSCRSYLEGKVSMIYGSLQSFINAFYISSEELMDMKENGMTLGVHCVKHLPYQGDAQQFYNAEIAPCKSFMQRELGITPHWYTPAFGGGENTRQMQLELEPILRANGFKGAFTTVEDHTTLTNKTFWFNRFDCNRLKFVDK